MVPGCRISLISLRVKIELVSDHLCDVNVVTLEVDSIDCNSFFHEGYMDRSWMLNEESEIVQV